MTQNVYDDMRIYCFVVLLIMEFYFERYYCVKKYFFAILKKYLFQSNYISCDD